MGKFTTFMFGATTGFAAGVLAAMALTPCTGEETRSFMSSLAKDMSEEFCDNGKRLWKDFRGIEDPELTPEEMRARIDAARARIAARQAELAKAEKGA